MRIFLAIMLALLPATASALSCVQPNPGTDLNSITVHGGVATLVIGTMTPKDPPPRRDEQETINALYRLEGEQLSPNGAASPFDLEIMFQSGCSLSWCGALPQSSISGLFVLERTGGGHWLYTGACRGRMYPAPSAAHLEALQKCVDNRRCGEAELQTLGQR